MIHHTTSPEGGAQRALTDLGTGRSVAVAGAASIHTWADGEAWCIAVLGELDLASVEPLRAALHGAEAEHASRVVVDLARLSFIDSSGLGVLVAAGRRLGPRLSILRPPGRVHRVFELGGLDGVLRFVNP